MKPVRQTGDEESQSAMLEHKDELAKDLEKWVKWHCVGTLRMPTEFFSTPGEDIKAREQVNKHVEALAASFAEHKTVNEDIKSAVASKDFVRDWTNKVKAIEQKGEEIDLTNGNYYTREEVMAYGKGAAFCGDHSVKACRLNEHLHGPNLMWQFVRSVIFAIRPDNATDARMLFLLGNSSNVKNTVFLKMGFVQIIEQIHRRYFSLLEHHEKAGTSPAGTMQALQVMKKDIGTSMKIKAATLGQWFQLAKQNQDTWVKLQQVMRGDFKFEAKNTHTKPPKRAESAAHFTAWCSLNVQARDYLLDQVLGGFLDTKSMHAECSMIKARARIHKELSTRLKLLGHLEHVADAAEEAGEYDDIEDQKPEYACALKEFPWLEKKCVGPWAKAVSKLKLKSELPSEILTGLDAALEMQKKQEVVLFFCHSVCVC